MSEKNKKIIELGLAKRSGEVIATWNELAEEFGISGEKMRLMVKNHLEDKGELRSRGEYLKDVGNNPWKQDNRSEKKLNEEKIEESYKEPNTKEITATGRIRTLDDLIKKCNIDLNIWKIDRWICNKWEVGRKGITRDLRFDGHAKYGTEKDGGGINVEPLYQIKVWMSKIVPDEQKFPVVQPINLDIPNIKIKQISNRQLKKCLIVPDSQNGYNRDINTGKLDPFHDRKCWDLVLQFAKKYQPEKIVFLGDMIDLSEWSDHFIKKPEFYFTTQPALMELTWWLAQLRKLCPSSQMIYLEGNHECFDYKTKCLTKDGWKKYSDLTKEDFIATYNKENGFIEYQKPSKIVVGDYEGDMYRIKNTSVDLYITPNHRLYYNCGGNTKFRTDQIKNIDIEKNRIGFKCSGILNNDDYDISDNMLKIIGWFITDGGLKVIGNSKSIAFYQRKSNVYKIQNLLDDEKIQYRYKERNRNIKEICGKKIKSQEPSVELHLNVEETKKILKYTNGSRDIPNWILKLSKRQFDILLSVVIDADVSIHKASKNSLMVYGKKEFLDKIQIACFSFGYRTSLVEYRDNIFRLNVTEKRNIFLDRFKSHVKIKKYSGKIWCVTVPNDTVVVKRNGKISITGNSRMKKSIYNNMVESYNLKPLGSRRPVLSIPSLLSLDKLKIEYAEDYPMANHWINDNLVVKHGILTRGGSGKTIEAILKECRASEIIGHIHRLEMASKTSHSRNKIVTYTVACPGTISRIDGIVPSKKGRENWQQGLAMIDYEDGNGFFSITPVPIYNGVCIYNGQYFKADDRLKEISRDINLKDFTIKAFQC